jgi:hypothetical protein
MAFAEYSLAASLLRLPLQNALLWHLRSSSWRYETSHMNRHMGLVAILADYLIVLPAGWVSCPACPQADEQPGFHCVQ